MPTLSRPGLTSQALAEAPLLVTPQVEKRELANGLTVLLEPDFSAPVVSIQFWCATGSIHESPWLGAGLSHLLEHLMFKGTPTRGNSRLAQDIHDLGGHLNAYTSFDRTVYHVDLPAEHALPALDILGDAVFNSLLPVEEYEKEMEVIRREFAMGRDNPDSELGKLLFHTAFLRHPYRHPVIGYLDLFNQLTREDVLAYYQQRYTPQNITLIVCGAVEPETLLSHAQETLEKYPRRKMPSLFLPGEPEQAQRRVERMTFPTQLSRLALAWPIPGIEQASIPALDLLATLLGGGRSSRLNQQCVEKLGLAEQIDAFAYAPATHGLWGIEARYAPDKETALLAEIAHQLEELQATPPALEELERVKRLSLLHQIHHTKTMSGKASALGRGWLLSQDPLFSLRYQEKMQAVTADELVAVAQTYLRPERENLVTLVPVQQTASPRAQDHILRPPRLPRSLALGAAQRAIYVPQPNLPLLSLRAVLPGGLLSEPEGKSGLCRLSAQLLSKGTRKRSAEKLARDIEQLGGALGSDAGNNSATLVLELLSTDTSRGVELFLEMLTETLPQEDELRTEKRKQLSLLQSENDYPMSQARDLVRSALYPGHPYSGKTLGTSASLETITLQDVMEYQKNQLLTQDLVLAISAPEPPENWLKQAALALQELAPCGMKVESPSLPKLSETVRRELRVDKEQAVLHIAFPTVPIGHEDHTALSVLDEALSDLGSRLFIRIREELGLAYFVGTSQFLGREAGYFFFYVGTSPEKRHDIESALQEEIARLADQGITATELARARTKMESQEKLEQQNPSQIAYTASLDELYGLGYSNYEKRRERLKALTLDSVNHVATRYFAHTPHVVAIVSPQ